MVDRSDSIANRLVNCFAAVFPSLSSDEIPRASMPTVGEWDSFALVTLIGVVEEEFHIALQVDDMSEFSSFELILEHLRADGVA
jgi:acyl carrier protein